jgi:type VII secretion integral membrane protein EccD
MMSVDFCHVTIVGPRRQVDLRVPSDLPCAELLPQVLRLSGELEPEPPAARWQGAWRLARLGEPPIPMDRSLADSGVLDGELLYLVPAEHAPPPAVVDDAVEAVKDAVDARRGQWTPATLRRLLVVAGAVGTVSALAPLVVRGRLAAGSGIVLLAALLTAAAVALWRARRDQLGSAAAGLAALPFWAAAALGPFALARGADGAAVAGTAGAGLLVAAVATGILVPPARAPCAAVTLAAAALCVGALGVDLLGASGVQVAAVLAVALVTLLPALPRAALALAGIHLDDDPGASAAKVGQGHRLLAWLLWGMAASLVATLAVLALSDGVFARLLCAMVAVVVALRARAFRLVAHVLPLALVSLAGVAGLLAGVTAGLLAGDGAPGAAAALLLGTGLMLAAAGLVPVGRVADSPRLGRLAWRAHLMASLSLIPLCLGALGVYDAVAAFARRLG